MQCYRGGLLVFGEGQAVYREELAVGVHAEPPAKLVGGILGQEAPAGRHHLRECVAGVLVESHASPLIRTCFLSRRIPAIRSRSAASQSSRSLGLRMTSAGAKVEAGISST